MQTILVQILMEPSEVMEDIPLCYLISVVILINQVEATANQHNFSLNTILLKCL